MTVRDILEKMDDGILLYVKNVKNMNGKNEHVLLQKNMLRFCCNYVLSLSVKKLNAGDYEIKGYTIDWRNNWYRGKVIVCEVVDKGGEE